MEMLAVTLRRNLDESRRVAPIKEKEDLAARLRQARLVADEMILELPDFLKELSERRHSCAYICGLNCGYGLNAYVSKHERPASFISPQGKTLRTPSQCRRHLVGIPRHIAVWAVRQGMRAEVGYWHGSMDAVFRAREGQRERDLGEGLKLWW